jgi:hypothetical protein
VEPTECTASSDQNETVLAHCWAVTHHVMKRERKNRRCFKFIFFDALDDFVTAMITGMVASWIHVIEANTLSSRIPTLQDASVRFGMPQINGNIVVCKCQPCRFCLVCLAPPSCLLQYASFLFGERIQSCCPSAASRAACSLFRPNESALPNRIIRISQRLVSAANRFGAIGEQIESMKHRLADSIILERGD